MEEKKVQQRPLEGVLGVKVLKAKGLKDVQMCCKQSPLVRLTMSGVKQRTQVHKSGDTSPVWNSPEMLFELNDNAIQLCVDVENDRLFCNDMIGKAFLSVRDLIVNKKGANWHDLTTNGGQIELEVNYYPPLKIFLKGAARLDDIQLVGKQDPYCVVHMNAPILGKDHRRKTKVHEDGDKMADWNAEFIYNMVRDEKSDINMTHEGQPANIKFEVWNDNYVKDNVIGEVTLPLAEVIQMARTRRDAKLKLTRADCADAGELFVRFEL